MSEQTHASPIISVFEINPSTFYFDRGYRVFCSDDLTAVLGFELRTIKGTTKEDENGTIDTSFHYPTEFALSNDK